MMIAGCKLLWNITISPKESRSVEKEVPAAASRMNGQGGKAAHSGLKLNEIDALIDITLISKSSGTSE